MSLTFNIIDTPNQYYNLLYKSQNNFKDFNSSFNIYLYIDILRATSTILSILTNQVTKVSIFKTKEFALEEYSNFFVKENILLCGEENSIKPNGFFGGNSPFDYLNNYKIKNSHILFTSSNGAKIIANDKNQGNYFELLENSNCERFILSFLNITSMINLINKLYKENSKKYEYFNVNLTCGGENNNISVEDSVCAIYFSQKLKEIFNFEITINQSKESEMIVNDLQKSDILKLNSKLNENIFEYIRVNSTHIKRLTELNCEKDIDFCLQFDKLNIIAKVFGNNIFKIF